MAPEELDLVDDDRLVFGAVVDVEVPDASVRPQLALGGAPRPRRSPGRAERRCRSRRRTPATGSAARGRGRSGCSRPAASRAARTVAPARALADRHDVAPARLCPGRVDERGLVRLSDRGQVAAGAAAPPTSRARTLRAGRYACVSRSRNGTWLIAAAMPGSWAAATSACPPPREDPNVAMRSASMPGSERANEIAACQSSSSRCGSVRIRLAGAVPEAAIVEHQRSDPGLGEALGERAPIASRAGQAVPHDDQRARRSLDRRCGPGRARRRRCPSSRRTSNRGGA